MGSCGDENERDKKEISKDKRSMEICSEYNEMNISSFLSKIGEVIKTISK